VTDHDEPEPFSVDRLDRESREAVAQPCVICGALTLSAFFGHPCCDPYDDSGRRVKKCKDILRGDR